MDWAASVQTWLTNYVQKRSFLPPQLPAEAVGKVARFEVPYPTRDDIFWLRGQPGPYVLIAGPQQGLITPGGDGAATIIYDHGRFRTAWMTRRELKAELEKRRAMVKEAATRALGQSP